MSELLTAQQIRGLRALATKVKERGEFLTAPGVGVNPDVMSSLLDHIDAQETLLREFQEER